MFLTGGTVDPITSAILAAVSAGITQPVISEAYNTLKALIVSKYGKKNDISDAIEKYENRTDSEARKRAIEEDVQYLKAFEDSDLIKIANKLIEKVKESPGGDKILSKFNITIENSQVGVIGDNTTIEGGIHFGDKKE